ncbi:MAG: hypothetical protein GY738_25100 [Pseudoalteromonas sp.]|nr:hypothetical protein [Pseudoalteromonas sp.]
MRILPKNKTRIRKSLTTEMASRRTQERVTDLQGSIKNPLALDPCAEFVLILNKEAKKERAVGSPSIEAMMDEEDKSLYGLNYPIPSHLWYRKRKWLASGFWPGKCPRMKRAKSF